MSKACYYVDTKLIAQQTDKYLLGVLKTPHWCQLGKYFLFFWNYKVNILLIKSMKIEFMKYSILLFYNIIHVL